MPESYWPPVALSNKIADMSIEEVRDLVGKGCTSGVQLESMAGCIWQLLAWGVRPWSLTQAARASWQPGDTGPGSILADTPMGLSSNPTQADSNQSKFHRRLGHFGDRLRGLK